MSDQATVRCPECAGEPFQPRWKKLVIGPARSFSCAGCGTRLRLAWSWPPFVAGGVGFLVTLVLFALLLGEYSPAAMVVPALAAGLASTPSHLRTPVRRG